MCVNGSGIFTGEIYVFRTFRDHGLGCSAFMDIASIDERRRKCGDSLRT